MEEPSCPATTRVKRNLVNHTIQCGKPLGHDGAHETKDVGSSRCVIWYGRADVAMPDDTRWRFERPKFNADKYVKQYARALGEE